MAPQISLFIHFKGYFKTGWFHAQSCSQEVIHQHGAVFVTTGAKVTEQYYEKDMMKLSSSSAEEASVRSSRSCACVLLLPSSAELSATRLESPAGGAPALAVAMLGGTGPTSPQLRKLHRGFGCRCAASAGLAAARLRVWSALSLHRSFRR